MAINKLEKIKSHLERRGTITATEAIELYNYQRLASAIHKLKKLGWEFDYIDHKNTNDNGCYRQYILIYSPRTKQAPKKRGLFFAEP